MGRDALRTQCTVHSVPFGLSYVEIQFLFIKSRIILDVSLIPKKKIYDLCDIYYAVELSCVLPPVLLDFSLIFRFPLVCKELCFHITYVYSVAIFSLNTMILTHRNDIMHHI